MTMKISLYKPTFGEFLLPATDHAAEEVAKLDTDRGYMASITEIRNIDHHRKYFALINEAYDCWEPPIRDDLPNKYQDVDIKKDREGFRKDLQILAGYYTAYYRLNGDVRLESKSIAFDKMDQPAFEELYDAVREVIVNMVPERRMSDTLRSLLEID
jgi:hypothetical protein